MQSTALPQFNADEFSAFLKTPQTFVLDLSKATVLEVIDELAKLKSINAPKAWQQFSCLKHQISGIQDSFGVSLMPIQITDVFWQHFISYMVNVSNLALSSVKTICARLCSALSWASRHNCKISPSYDFVKLPSYNMQQIALTLDEVSHIYHFDIKTIKKRKQNLRTLERVRDMFVLCCNLGQRYSDMVRIDKTCFDRNIFTILQQKTGTYARVDIERMSMDRNTVYAILEKYNYKAPYDGDISNFDKYLKELLVNIGGSFVEDVKRERKVNGLVETSFKPKYKLITSHTGRRTFATVNILRGYTVSEVRRATGHKSIMAFEKYMCYYEDYETNRQF